MLKKIGISLLTAVMLIGCSGNKTDKVDYSANTLKYIELSNAQKYDDAEELAALEMDNFFKSQREYIEDEFELDNIKRELSKEYYEKLNKALMDAGKDIIVGYTVDKAETDEYDDTLVKVKAKVLSVEELSENFEDITDDIDDKITEYIDADKSDRTYNQVKAEAYAKFYDDKVIDKFVETVKKSYKDAVLKFSYVADSNKISYMTID